MAAIAADALAWLPACVIAAAWAGAIAADRGQRARIARRARNQAARLA